MIEHGNVITTEDELKPEIPGQSERSYQSEECPDLKLEPGSGKYEKKSNVASGGIWGVTGIISTVLVFTLVILCSVVSISAGFYFKYSQLLCL